MFDNPRPLVLALIIAQTLIAAALIAIGSYTVGVVLAVWAASCAVGYIYGSIVSLDGVNDEP